MVAARALAAESRKTEQSNKSKRRTERPPDHKRDPSHAGVDRRSLRRRSARRRCDYSESAQQGRWTAFLSRTVLRDASFGLCLRHTGGVTDDLRVVDLTRDGQRFMQVQRCDSSGVVRAPACRGGPSGGSLRSGRLTLRGHGHGAVVRTIAAAAGWKLRLVALAQGQQRREHLQEKHCQQQHGQDATQ